MEREGEGGRETGGGRGRDGRIKRDRVGGRGREGQRERESEGVLTDRQTGMEGGRARERERKRGWEGGRERKRHAKITTFYYGSSADERNLGRLVTFPHKGQSPNDRKQTKVATMDQHIIDTPVTYWLGRDVVPSTPFHCRQTQPT